ncbi:head GIN domain-containing protein [Aquimarina agarilytica]|uniref:head GIN domain-containing protein n=1 Tax=Aquimarina agarilytica TaxID=1087449 RepID=UPI000287B593|nr:head GIN domain-containing protein [Aquimarina agarilytica]
MIQNHANLKKIGLASLFWVFILSFNFLQSQTFKVENFNKISIHPHIQVDFIHGDTNEVVINSISVPEEKLTVEVENNTLQLYLEGAKIFTKKEKKDWDKHRKPIYKGTIVKATITFKYLEDLSLKGEEDFTLKNAFKSDELDMYVYGASSIRFNELELDNFKAVMYGEAQLTIEKGRVDYQKFTAYGAANVNSEKVSNKRSKIMAYGEAKFNLNVSDELKVSSFGEATIRYTGNPKIEKGLNLGETTITRIDTN